MQKFAFLLITALIKSTFLLITHTPLHLALALLNWN